ncbi:hypothetical protein T02_12267 [Trichinella nativa]|uniref:Uncharacterized protein n=1 Tax=Trichinella nativa TaxID=6335 RepID=A0A0V1L244_9BILA|nr:hypothetical protein T02_12267 [Trichinella nativa]
MNFISKVSPMYQRLNDRLLQCGIFHWLSALMNLWSHTMVGAAQRFHKGKADSHGLQGLDALWYRWLSLPPKHPSRKGI